MWNYLVDKSVLQIFLCWDVTSPPFVSDTQKFAPLSCTHSVKVCDQSSVYCEYLLLLSITSVLVVDLSLRVIGFVVFPIGFCRQSWQMMLLPIEKRHFGGYGIILWIIMWIVFPSHATDETITKFSATWVAAAWRKRTKKRNKWVSYVKEKWDPRGCYNPNDLASRHMIYENS